MCFYLFYMACSVWGWWNILGPSVVGPMFFLWKLDPRSLGPGKMFRHFDELFHGWINRSLSEQAATHSRKLERSLLTSHVEGSRHTTCIHGSRTGNGWSSIGEWSKGNGKSFDQKLKIFPLIVLKMVSACPSLDEIFLSFLEDCCNMDRLRFAPIHIWA